MLPNSSKLELSKQVSCNAHSMCLYMLLDAELKSRQETPSPAEEPPKKKRRQNNAAKAMDPMRQERQQDCAQRHNKFLPHLEKAHLLFKDFLRAHYQGLAHSNEFSIQEPGDQQQQENNSESNCKSVLRTPDDTAETSTAECLKKESEETAWDLGLLANMKSLLKPRFQFLDETDSCRLFDTIVTNPKPETRTAWAHDKQVWIPPQSSFLLADMSNFDKLVIGKSLFTLLWEPLQICSSLMLGQALLGTDLCE